MQAIPAVMTPDRPGKNSAWMPLRGAARYDEPESAPFITHPHPRDSGINSLDPVRATFWQACRHLFPPHALAAQTPNGSMVISWSVMDEPDARYPYAAPVMLRFDAALVETMSRCDARQRLRIAKTHEAGLREGLHGYDPYARFPNAHVVVIG